MFKDLTQSAFKLYIDAMKVWNSKNVTNCMYKDELAYFVYQNVDPNMYDVVTNMDIAGCEIRTCQGYKFREIDVSDDHYCGDFVFTYDNTRDFLISYYKLLLFEIGYQLKTNNKYNDEYKYEYEKIYENLPSINAPESDVNESLAGANAGIERISYYLRNAFTYADEHAESNTDTGQDAVDLGKFSIFEFCKSIEYELDIIFDELSSNQQEVSDSDNSNDDNSCAGSNESVEEPNEESDENSSENNNSMTFLTTHPQDETLDTKIIGKKRKRAKYKQNKNCWSK